MARPASQTADRANHRASVAELCGGYNAAGDQWLTAISLRQRTRPDRREVRPHRGYASRANKHPTVLPLLGVVEEVLLQFGQQPHRQRDRPYASRRLGLLDRVLNAGRSRPITCSSGAASDPSDRPVPAADPGAANPVQRSAAVQARHTRVRC